jgi:chemotaxis regulatin CheY-phosphate phosphatase CheZ
MIDEPKIRVVLSKHHLAEELEQLGRIVQEYSEFLARLDPPADWTPAAQRLLKKHWDQLERARVSMQSLDLAGAVIRHVVAMQPGKRIALSFLDGPADPGAGLPLAPLPLPTTPESFRALVADVVALIRNAPLSMQEKLRFLLNSLLRLVTQAPGADPERLEELLSEINLLTSNRESQSLVHEIALLAREVYDSIQAVSEGLPLEALTESTEGASEAVRKLNGVMQRLEQAASENLDRVEVLIRKQEEDRKLVEGLNESLRAAQQRLAELKAAHPQHAQALERVQGHLSDGVGAAAMQLLMRTGTTADRHMTLLSSQGFQDHTGATLKRIIGFVEDLQGQIVSLLKRYKSVLELSLGPPNLSEQAEVPEPEEAKRQSQDDVDKLLANLGF